MVEVRRTLGRTALQFYGVALFDTIKIGAAVTAGFSFTTNSIGRERQSRGGMEWKRTRPFIFGTVSLACFRQSPEWEFVYSLHHRSGANGVFGRIREGYNANIAGVRHKF